MQHVAICIINNLNEKIHIQHLNSIIIGFLSDLVYSNYIQHDMVIFHSQEYV